MPHTILHEQCAIYKYISYSNWAKVLIPLSSRRRHVGRFQSCFAADKLVRGRAIK